MSKKTRFLTSIVAGIDAGLFILVVALLLDTYSPGLIFKNTRAEGLDQPTPIGVRSRPVKTVVIGNSVPIPPPANSDDPPVVIIYPTPTAPADGSITRVPIYTTTPAPKFPHYTPPVSAAPASAGILPARFKVPALGIDATVEQIGLDKDGQLSVPSKYNDVGWLKYGPRPGAAGNAVIDGHLDSETGPAVFYKLRYLKPGDKIYVLDAAGQQKTFVVESTAVYPYDQAPLEQIFGPSQEARLNLITCTGVFDRATANYNQRFVAYTRLVS